MKKNTNEISPLTPCILIVVFAILKTLLSISAVLVAKTSPNSDYSTFYYFANEIISLLLPLMTSLYLFYNLRHRKTRVFIFVISLYFVIFLLCHVITTAFYCQLVFDSLWGWTEDDVIFLFTITRETFFTLVYLIGSALIAYAILPMSYHDASMSDSFVPTYSVHHPVSRSILAICVIFGLGAAIREFISYTLPALSNVADGFAPLTLGDAIYIVFKYLFYIAIVTLPYFLSIRRERRISK